MLCPAFEKSDQDLREKLAEKSKVEDQQKAQIASLDALVQSLVKQQAELEKKHVSVVSLAVCMSDQWELVLHCGCVCLCL